MTGLICRNVPAGCMRSPPSFRGSETGRPRKPLAQRSRLSSYGWRSHDPICFPVTVLVLTLCAGTLSRDAQEPMGTCVIDNNEAPSVALEHVDQTIPSVIGE